MDQEMCAKINGPPVCAKCNKAIFDGTILQVGGQYWHNSCLQCAICRKLLNGCCHVKDNNFYCREDFVRTFGARCDGCKTVISPSECVHVVNGHVYHTACFTCSVCTCKLVPGNYLYMRDDARLVCANDFRAMLENSNSDTNSESDESGSDDAYPNTNVTNLHDNQIRLLLDAYSNDNRPNKSARRHLSQQTGLKPRLIQIWFQNKRAQEKQLRRKNRNVHNSDGCQNTDKEEKNYQDKHEHISKAYGFQGQNLNCHSRNQRTVTHVSTGCDVIASHYETGFDSYQLYCPLDYLLPNEMPPNVDLSAIDICNGEVVASKQNSGSDKYHVTSPEMLSDPGNCSWLSL